ncbi:MAG: O-antigen ligase family protein [Acidobacteriota bacterium]
MRLDSMTACVPALALLVTTAWSGTASANEWGALVNGGAWLLLAWSGAYAWRDPLDLGDRRWIVGLGVLLVVMSSVASPALRPAWPILALLPAIVLTPAGVARLLGSPFDNTVRDNTVHDDSILDRVGLPAISAVAAVIALIGVIDAVRFPEVGATAPVGHHNLLALWLVGILPLALLPSRDAGWRRVLAVTSGVIVLVAIVATRSLSGLIGLLVMGLIWGSRRHPRMTVGVVMGIVFLASPRVADIAADSDISTLARAGYLEAGIEMVEERPFLGWGPGTTPWRLGAFHQAEPGVNPPGEVVADPHNFWLRLMIELGLGGIVCVGLAAWWWWRRPIIENTVTRACTIGLVGWVVVASLTRPMAAPATLFLVAVIMGVRLTATERRMATSSPATGSSSREWKWVRLGTVAATLTLVPLWGAGLAWRLAPTSTLALDLDAGMPLYRWVVSRDSDQPSRAAEDALDAARRAPGVAALWLSAGIAGQAAQAPWATEALVRACELDPLGAVAPFRLATHGDPEDPRAVSWAARALASEPLLVAAAIWQRPERQLIYTEAVARLYADDRLPLAWRDELETSARRMRTTSEQTQWLVLRADEVPATSVARHVFHRSSRPVPIIEIEVRVDVLPVPWSLARDRATPSLFDGSACTLGRTP